MAWYDHLIDRDATVQGGAPVLRGTRTPVRTVITLYYTTYPGDLKAVEAALPHLTAEQIRAALAYHTDYREAIESDIQRHRRALDQFRKAS